MSAPEIKPELGERESETYMGEKDMDISMETASFKR